MSLRRTRPVLALPPSLALPLALASSLLPLSCSTTSDRSNLPPLDLSASTGADLATAPRDLTAVGPNADLAMTGCATSTYVAKQSPAAMLVLLDKSENMSHDNKWAFAAQAIVQAIDQDVFDTMSLGLYAAPSGTTKGPACVFGLPVACLAPAFPQIDLALAGTSKSSDPNGVRHDIKKWLASNNPDSSGAGEANPLYDGAKASILSLQGWNQPGKRILFIVTGGAISCTSLSKRAAFHDCNGCNDWEDPGNLVTLLQQANQDPQKSIDTFVVGVPGAETTGQSCPNADNPPYHMRLALSAMAYAGSPKNAPANCDGKTFTKGGGDPKISCHVDLTQGNFNAKAISDTISAIRGKVLGCTFELPQPDGGTVDKDAVNVTLSANGMNPMDLYRRKDPKNPCTTDGCWDYDMAGRIQLIGKACDTVSASTNAKVQIVVGCATIIG